MTSEETRDDARLIEAAQTLVDLVWSERGKYSWIECINADYIGSNILIVSPNYALYRGLVLDSVTYQDDYKVCFAGHYGSCKAYVDVPGSKLEYTRQDVSRDCRDYVNMSLATEARLYKQKIRAVHKIKRELKWYWLSGKLNKLRESLRRQIDDLRTY